ncbi:MAG: hypothetical protein WDZ41_02825 [Candidatus Babeliales bacterium]
MKLNIFIFCIIFVFQVHGIFSPEFISTFTNPQQPQFYEKYYTPPPSEADPGILLPACLLATMLNYVSIGIAIYLFVNRAYQLQNELSEIQSTHFWQAPMNALRKLNRYTHCLWDIGKTALQITIIRLITKCFMQNACPKDLRSHRNNKKLEIYVTNNQLKPANPN